MTKPIFDVVTGAFGYIGKYIARRLLDRGRSVVSITGHPNRPNPFGSDVNVCPFHFDRPDRLTADLRGAHTLYNTYWIRFPRGKLTFERAVSNSKVLLQCARDAGVARVVHISITNPSLDSPLGYFRGKARVEAFLRASGLSHAILRPTVVFGREDILVNNIAWLLRRFPIFAVPGSGDYRVQPVYVEDLADLAIEAGFGVNELVTDAVGPEVFTFRSFVAEIANAIGSRSRVWRANPTIALTVARLAGWCLGDVLLTRDEVAGLSANLLVSAQPPTCPTRFTHWLNHRAETVGVTYASELARHYR